MSSLAGILTALAALIALQRLLCLRSMFTGLSVRWAFFWWLGSLSYLCLLALAEACAVVFSPAAQSVLHYGAAVLLLTPAVSTLGARRHGLQAWQFFVVLPLLLVLMWPAAAETIFSRDSRPLMLSGPALAGYIAVLILSAGPGLGGGLTWSCLLHLAACLWMLAPAAGWLQPGSSVTLPVVFLLTAEAELTTWHLLRRRAAVQKSASVAERMNCVWLLFQDLYGPVWTHRFLNRMRQFQQAERWACSLELGGFEATDSTKLTAVTLQQPLESFRWVLSRFAEPSWIEQQFTDGFASETGAAADAAANGS